MTEILEASNAFSERKKLDDGIKSKVFIKHMEKNGEICQNSSAVLGRDSIIYFKEFCLRIYYHLNSKVVYFLMK